MRKGISYNGHAIKKDQFGRFEVMGFGAPADGCYINPRFKTLRDAKAFCDRRDAGNDWQYA